MRFILRSSNLTNIVKGSRNFKKLFPPVYITEPVGGFSGIDFLFLYFFTFRPGGI